MRIRALLSALLLSSAASANVHRFGYAYETGVLPAGGHEVEVATTWRVGRADVYSRLDQRAEMEFGVTDRLMTALYLNWTKISERDPATGGMMTGSEFGGISSEWKYKMTDPTADALGAAGYVELTGDTAQAEAEVKLILDKTFGPVTVAYNAVGEAEWNWVPSAFINDERVMEHMLGVSVAPATGFGIGVEGLTRSVYVDGALDVAAAFAGPVFHFAKGEFWITATCLFQVKGLKTSPAGETLELTDHERVNARILVALPL